MARRADFARYGLPWSERSRYEDDHLVPLCLGGSDTMANRWPELRWGEWNAYKRMTWKATLAEWCVPGN